MLVNIIRSFDTPTRRYFVGDNPDVDSTVAAKWIADGLATRDTDNQQTGQAVGGGGGGLGVRKRRLARILHHVRNEAFDFSEHEILRVPDEWAAGKRFYPGQPFRMPGVTSHFFLFFGVQNAGDQNVSNSALTTINSFTPDVTTDYTTYRDVPSRAVIYQFPARKFPVTKKKSLLQVDGVTPIVPVVTQSVPSTYPSGQASQIRFSRVWLAPLTVTGADATTNQTEFLRRFKTPHGPGFTNNANQGWTTNRMFKSVSGGGTLTESNGPQTATFDCTASSLTLEFSRGGASPNAGDPVVEGFVIIDGVAVDFHAFRHLDAPSAGYANTSFTTFNFRDARRRRVTIIPGNNYANVCDSIHTSTDGLIIAPNSLEVYAAAASDSTWAGALPWPNARGGRQNVPQCLGFAMGLGPTIDIATGGIGHWTPNWQKGPGNLPHAQVFMSNPTIFDTRQGGRDLAYYAMGYTAFDQDLTVMTRQQRKDRMLEFVSYFKDAQPNSVLVIVRKRYDGPNSECNQMTLADASALNVGDVITNKSPAQIAAAQVAAVGSTPGVKVVSIQTTATVVAKVGNAIHYWVTPQQSVREPGTSSNPARWDGGLGAQLGFGVGDPIYRAGTQVTTVATASAARIARRDSVNGFTMDAYAYIEAEELQHQDMMEAIELSGLEKDQWMVIANIEFDEQNSGLTDWQFYSHSFADPANLAIGNDTIHHWGHPQLAKYIATQVREAVVIDL